MYINSIWKDMYYKAMLMVGAGDVRCFGARFQPVYDG